MTKIAVLGAGINGAACAVKIKEKYSNIDVTIISNEFSPHTTGDGSGGLWYPYLCGKTPTEWLSKWGEETFTLYYKLWVEGGYDISLTPLFELHGEEKNLRIPEWSRYVFGYSILKRRQLEYFSEMYSKEYRAGLTFTTFVVNPPTILAHLYQRFADAGGKFQKMVITSLTDGHLDEYDVVVNCLGVGARDVVSDAKVFPIRGQICKVKAPWVNETIFDDDTGHYIIPNINFCVLGGTHQENDYNRDIDPKDTDFVPHGCQRILPGLKAAETIKHWTGLRPGREHVRLESEELNRKLYIHNYGHGGSGLTLFWGCGSEVLLLFEKHIMRKMETCKL